MSTSYFKDAEKLNDSSNFVAWKIKLEVMLDENDVLEYVRGNVPEPPERYPCYHLWLAPAIRWNGEITYCCNLPNLGSEVLGKYPESNLTEAWKSPRLAQIRQEHKDGVYNGACKGCDSWKAYRSIF